MKLIPTDSDIQFWIDTYVPLKDLFFITEVDLEKLNIDVRHVLLMPSKEFFQHPSYSQIGFVNSYEYWNIKKCTYVIVARPEWIEQLPEKKRAYLLNVQIEIGRGLVWPISFFEKGVNLPSRYIVGESIVIQRNMWDMLSADIKKAAMMKMVGKWWEDGKCEAIHDGVPSHVKLYANSFGRHEGANCLAAVIFAVSGTEWMMNEWLHQETFLECLKQHLYSETAAEVFFAGDVAVWKDGNGVIQHASYYCGEQIFFNKQGQTTYNAWKLVAENDLMVEWQDLSIHIYRKKQKYITS
ncbi:hypothetical protein [Bacillus sp. 1P06AnD]|uniref:hypothetical protein n=1 Tax=Bacillus sp. 1P06AnD TaxID=3132208 RepID=UPI0039A2C8AE